MFSKTALAAFAAVSLFAGASSASAATPQTTAPGTNTVSVTISYGDLDLNTNAGARAMFARISHAARRICEAQPPAQALDMMAAYESCMTSVTSRALTKLGNTKVWAVAGRQAPTTVAYNSGR
jgi:UrcA family protein